MATVVAVAVVAVVRRQMELVGDDDKQRAQQPMRHAALQQLLPQPLRGGRLHETIARASAEGPGGSARRTRTA